MKINDKWSRGAWSDEENKRLTRGINAHGYGYVLVYQCGLFDSMGLTLV